MKNHGLTLIELLVCLVIITITLVVAVPAFNRLMQSTQAGRITYELMQLCNQARSHAAGRRQTVTLCGSTDGRNCDAQWAHGVLMFHDLDRSGTRGHLEEVIRYTPMDLDASVIGWKGLQKNVLIYESFGTPYADNGTFTYCTNDLTPEFRRQVIVSRSGRVRASRDRDKDGVHESVSGGLIVCP